MYVYTIYTIYIYIHTYTYIFNTCVYIHIPIQRTCMYRLYITLRNTKTHTYIVDVCPTSLMVHLVLERPRESVLPLLIQHCIGSNTAQSSSSKNPKGRTDVAKKPFWSIAFPIYYVLLSFTCNVLFLVGSCLFLPIKSSQASVSFTFVVENIDVDKVMTSNKGDLFEYPVAKSSLRF